MDIEKYYPLGATLIGGGLAGAVLNNLISKYNNRLQPIEREIKVVKVFRDSIGSKGLKANITIEKNGSEVKYSNLYIVNVSIKNIGNVDYDKFRLGLTLKPSKKIIDVRPQSTDRLHKITPSSEIEPTNPQEFVDVVCEPFIRRFEYKIRLIVVSESKDKMFLPGDISISSTSPIKFVDKNRLSKTTLELLYELVRSINIPFIRIR
jgi:hypothetical protein